LIEILVKLEIDFVPVKLLAAQRLWWKDTGAATQVSKTYLALDKTIWKV